MVKHIWRAMGDRSTYAITLAFGRLYNAFCQDTKGGVAVRRSLYVKLGRWVGCRNNIFHKIRFIVSITMK